MDTSDSGSVSSSTSLSAGQSGRKSQNSLFRQRSNLCSQSMIQSSNPPISQPIYPPNSQFKNPSYHQSISQTDDNQSVNPSPSALAISKSLPPVNQAVNQSLIVRAEAARAASEKKLLQLLTELVQTERKYVLDLEETCRMYLPLAGWDYARRTKSSERSRKPRRRSSTSSVSLDTEEDIIKHPSKQQVRQMLGNIEELKDYHERLMLPQLEAAVLNGDSSAIRGLFHGELGKLSILYGRYCINKTRSSLIVEEYKDYFALLQFKRQLPLRVDAELIKPIQRLTRYHMFLSSLSKTSLELGLTEAAQDFSIALEGVLTAANHTNMMMWIGRMKECPLELASQGQLLKQGRVLTRLLKTRRKSFQGLRTKSVPGTQSYLLLFQHSVIICRESSSCDDNIDPQLVYCTHVSVNQVRVRDTCAEDDITFELQRVEGTRGLQVNPLQEGALARVTCQNEQEKDTWVSAINCEVKILRNVAKSLTNTYLSGLI